MPIKHVIQFLLGLGLFALCLFLILERGQSLFHARANEPTARVVSSSREPSATAPSASLLDNLRENFQDPLGLLFVQLILIVLAARCCGTLAGKLGQPPVIGEMIAGILLGPSFLGWLWPNLFHFIFVPSSLGVLRLLAQIGVCLFMFVVGMELDVDMLKQQAGTAVLVSQASIFFPYLLGMFVSLFLFTPFAGPATGFPAFALFVGISMSITAFPVLARILEERGLTKTPLGSTALICAAANDVMAWSILALVVAFAKAASIASAALNIGLVVVFVCAMIFVVKPRLPSLLKGGTDGRGAPGRSVIAAVFIFLILSSLATEMLGIHALFGAFLAGVVMPAHGAFRDSLKLRLENFSSVFLLPVFFAFTGLRTQVGLLDKASGPLICLGLILIATAGKLGGTMLAARFTGVNWYDSFRLGALMNTRGLVELIALNIGYDLQILSPRIFTMLVIMALVTTFITGPLLGFADYFLSSKPLAEKPA